MSDTMKNLRAAMVRQRQISNWDRKNIRWLSPGWLEQTNVVLRALGSGDSLSVRMRDCGSVGEYNNINYCRLPHCGRCLLRRRALETGRAINQTFADATNDDLLFLTLLLPVTTEISFVNDLMNREKRRLINLINRQRRHDVRWNDVHLTGFWELERISVEDYAGLGKRKREALSALGAPVLSYPNTTIWVPHLHAIVQIGSVSRSEIRRALEGSGPKVPYRVQIQGFRANVPVEKNLQSVIRYCMKFRVESGYKLQELEVLRGDDTEQPMGSPKPRQWWSDEDIAAYVRWAKTTRGGFRSLRFKIGKGKPVTTKETCSRPSKRLLNRLTPSMQTGTALPSTVARSSRSVARGYTVGRSSEIDAIIEGLRALALPAEMLRREAGIKNHYKDTNWLDLAGADPNMWSEHAPCRKLASLSAVPDDGWRCPPTSPDPNEAHTPADCKGMHLGSAKCIGACE